MAEPTLELRDIKTTAKTTDDEIVPILKGIDLKIKAGDFITTIGTNGASKSMLLNITAGSLRPDSGFLLHNGLDTTKMSEEKWTRLIGRVFQDSKLGTVPRMTVTENLLLATKKGKRRSLRIRKSKQNLLCSKELAAVMNNGLENCLNTFVEGLSGDQRQALSFLMATIEGPDILPLDEHTVALDPHTSENSLVVTDQQIKENKLTALMITYHIEDALKYGNRLLVLKDGKVRADINEREKQNLKVGDLYKYFGD